MKLIKLKQICIFGIITMFTILALNLSINVNADPQYITVYTNRWNESTGEIDWANESWLLDDYNNFMGALIACETIEDQFEIYQNYNFIPANETYESFKAWSGNIYNENEEMIEENSTEFIEEHAHEESQSYHHFMGTGVFFMEM